MGLHAAEVSSPGCGDKPSYILMFPHALSRRLAFERLFMIKLFTMPSIICTILTLDDIRDWGVCPVHKWTVVSTCQNRIDNQDLGGMILIIEYLLCAWLRRLVCWLTNPHT